MSGSLWSATENSVSSSTAALPGGSNELKFAAAVAKLEKDVVRLKHDWHLEASQFKSVKLEFYLHVAKDAERWQEQQALNKMLLEIINGLDSEAGQLGDASNAAHKKSKTLLQHAPTSNSAGGNSAKLEDGVKRLGELLSSTAVSCVAAGAGKSLDEDAGLPAEAPEMPQGNGLPAEAPEKPQGNGLPSEAPEKPPGNGLPAEAPEKPQGNSLPSEAPEKPQGNGLPAEALEKQQGNGSANGQETCDGVLGATSDMSDTCDGHDLDPDAQQACGEQATYSSNGPLAGAASSHLEDAAMTAPAASCEHQASVRGSDELTPSCEQQGSALMVHTDSQVSGLGRASCLRSSVMGSPMGKTVSLGNTYTRRFKGEIQSEQEVSASSSFGDDSISEDRLEAEEQEGDHLNRGNVQEAGASDGSSDSDNEDDEEVSEDLVGRRISAIQREREAAELIQRLWREKQVISDDQPTTEIIYTDSEGVVQALNIGASSTTLLEALEAQNEELAMILLASASYRTLNQTDALGRTALHLAARHDMSHFCEALLGHKHFDAADAVHWGGWTALHLAARQGHAGPVKVIMASPKFHMLNMQDGDGRTVLHCAAVFGRLEVIRAIVKNPHFTMGDAHNNGGFTAVHVAERHGNAEACKLIVQYSKESTSSRSRTHAARSNTDTTFRKSVCSPKSTIHRSTLSRMGAGQRSSPHASKTELSKE